MFPFLRLHGRAFLVRYADDFLIGFSCDEDARRVLDVLAKRFGKYSLTPHLEKTRLGPFYRPPHQTDASGSSEWSILGDLIFWGSLTSEVVRGAGSGW
jgi:hypothetical protein